MSEVYSLEKVDLLKLCSAAKPRPTVVPERNTETFKGTYTRDPKYLAWVDEILNTNVNQVSKKCQ